MRVLVVEDDPLVAGWMRRVLREDGMRADVAATGEMGRQLAATADYDLVLVDLGLPDQNGILLVRALREAGATMPILIVTGRDEDEAIVAGLDAGADDYLVKPLPGPVLRARLRAALRRGGSRRLEALSCGELSLDRLARTVRARGQPLSLRPREYAVLEQLIVHAGQVVRRTELLERVWGYEFDPGTNVLDATVSRLRRELRRAVSHPRLETVRGVGFMLTCGE